MLKSQPFLSIIISCYNYEIYVSECIRSVLSQNYNNFEIIVVDDGSTDNSWDKIQEFGDRINAVRTENRGSLKTCLNALSLAKGDFIYFLDADDVLCEGALAEIAPYLRPDVSKIQFMLLPIDKDGAPIGNAFPSLQPTAGSGPLIQSIQKKGYYDTPPTSGNIYRRDVYEDLGDMAYERGIDGVSYLLAPFVGTVISIDKPLGKYRIHNANLSSFSEVTSKRMKAQVDRFMGRLHHLAELVQSRPTATEKVEVRNNYAYVMELNTMSLVIDGKRPGIGHMSAYIGAVVRENTGNKRIALCLFGLALFLLPNRMARHLAAIRIDPSRSHQIRSRFKQAFCV
ncbi:glycosyltransferase involved in cell wall biosynthesis [Rhizobium mesoamericanum]|uniref:glycosyltransferase family 2 protein n=1 Tax=Rhizobium mesoamericanum TaxID=1079800 RepID=UPI002782FC1E|nr:glycosyltransferase [Rhizobium mesoamericanum]MDQ0562016.1 glycosyltransferase involved in cell wall biosynthesis [Rhizobium mesoamericanum]